MKFKISGVKAEVVEATEVELASLKAALSFSVAVMRIPYRPDRGRYVTWDTTEKCFLFEDKYFASPFLKLLPFQFEVVTQSRHVDPDEHSQLPFELKTFQAEAIQKALLSSSALIVGPTSIGKTYLIATLVDAFRNYKVAVLVHNKGLAQQNYERLTKWFPSLEVGRVYAGKREYEAQVVVATFQSLRNLSFKADVVLIDECVHILAPTYLQTLIHTEATRWYGFTATPRGRSDKLDARLEDLFVNKILVGSVKKGYEEKLLCPVDFFVIKYQNPHYRIPEWRLRDVNFVYQKFVALDERRNELIRFLANYELERTGKVVLVLVHRMNHLSQLKKLIPESVVVNYKSKVEDREEVRKLKKGVVLATRVIEEGVDNHHIYSIINAACVRSRIAIIQRIGRGLRFEEGKRLAFYDIWDQYPSTLESQGKARISMYRSLGDVQILDPA